jgi:hypothetical protein
MSDKEKMKELYKLEETATNEFDRMIFKMMNENFRKQEKVLLDLEAAGLLKIKKKPS